MPKLERQKRTWSDLLKKEGCVQLPVAHDALTARLIERAGYPAYQIGGFGLEGSLYAYPDADLTHLGEKSAAVDRIIQASSLPVLVDADDGYGDAKNVTRTVEVYEAMGVDALFIEDQKPPKECGHMSGKVVVPVESMVNKVEAACAARRHPQAMFILARSDAREPEGLDRAIERARRYRQAGADGVYIEGIESEKELQTVGEAFKGFPLATSILERGGKTPWVSPKKLQQMGYAMILYPATILFRATQAIRQGLKDLAAGKPLAPDESVDMKQFDEIVAIKRWESIQKKYKGGPNWDQQG